MFAIAASFDSSFATSFASATVISFGCCRFPKAVIEFKMAWKSFRMSDDVHFDDFDYSNGCVITIVVGME